MINSYNKSSHRPFRRIRMAQRTRMGMMPHQKIILASGFLFVFVLGFVVFVNVSEPGSATAASKNEGVPRTECKNIVTPSNDDSSGENCDALSTDTMVTKSLNKK